MGYEIPAGLGVRLAFPDRTKRVVSFIGDGTFLMAPTELVTAAQEAAGHRRHPREPRLPGDPSAADAAQRPGVRQRVPLPRRQLEPHRRSSPRKPARLDGEYLQVDLVQIARGLGARALRATTAAEVRDALAGTRDHDGPVVIVIPAIPHADLPPAGVWDVAPAEVSDVDNVAQLRSEYETELTTQRWFG